MATELNLYNASAKTPELIAVPAQKYLMIDGTGDPNTSQEFQQAIAALFGLAYTIKFSRKKQGVDSSYKITPLEALWWSDDPHAFESNADKSKWHWTVMIAQPDVIKTSEVKQAAKELREKKHLPLLESVQFKKMKEGKSVQIMHIGPYSTEGPTIERMHKYAHDEGYELAGKHHEIYLGDPRRSKPEKLKTILRQPLMKQAKLRREAPLA